MSESIWQIFGRSHIVLLHFPLALLIIASIVELWSICAGKLWRAHSEASNEANRGNRPARTAFVCLLYAVLSGIAAAWAGWIYAGNEFTETSGLQLHRWLGIASIGLAILSFSCASACFIRPRVIMLRAYQLLLMFAAITVGLTGHFGGELVHGKGFLLEPMSGQSDREEKRDSGRLDHPDTDPEMEPVASIRFEDDIEPLFSNQCVKCHRAGKARGDFRLDSLEHAMTAVVPGDPEASLLIQLVSMPEADERSMPKDKPSLSSEQIALLVEWVSAMKLGVTGSPSEEELFDAPVYVPGPKIEQTKSSLAYQLADTPVELSADEVVLRDAAIERLRNNQIAASVRAKGTEGVEVRVFEGRHRFGDKQLELLKGLESSLTILDLSGTVITDIGLDELCSNFPRLRILRLGATRITDAGLSDLQELTELALLDINQTQVSAVGVRHSLDLPQIKVINCWATQLTQEELHQLRTQHDHVDIQFGD